MALRRLPGGCNLGTRGVGQAAEDPAILGRNHGPTQGAPFLDHGLQGRRPQRRRSFGTSWPAVTACLALAAREIARKIRTPCPLGPGFVGTLLTVPSMTIRGAGRCGPDRTKTANESTALRSGPATPTVEPRGWARCSSCPLPDLASVCTLRNERVAPAHRSAGL